VVTAASCRVSAVARQQRQAFERAIVASVIAKRYVARALMRAVGLLAEPIDVDRFILAVAGGGEKNAD